MIGVSGLEPLVKMGEKCYNKMSLGEVTFACLCGIIKQDAVAAPMGREAWPG